MPGLNARMGKCFEIAAAVSVAATVLVLLATGRLDGLLIPFLHAAFFHEFG